MSIPSDQDSDDPWTLLPSSAAAVQPESDRPALQVKTIEGVEPLDMQIGVFPKKTVPDALYDALFGQLEPTAAEIEATGGGPPMRTYAILDAAKVTNLPELLERSGLEYRCLFKGAAYDELKNVAPWIVRLEENNAFTRTLFTRSEAPWHLWDTEPGIYVRAHGTLDDMWRHFRKFTRVQDESGKWFFFAFWSSPISTKLFLRSDEKAIQAFIRPLFLMHGRALTIVTASRQAIATVQAISPLKIEKRWILTQPVWEFMRQLRREQQFDEIIGITWRHTGPHVTITEATMTSRLRDKRDQWFKIGFWRRDHLAKLCTWETMLGPNFLESYGNGEVSRAAHAAQSDHELIQRIENFLDGQAVRKVDAVI